MESVRYVHSMKKYSRFAVLEYLHSKYLNNSGSFKTFLLGGYIQKGLLIICTW